MNEHPQWTSQAKVLLEASAQELDAATLSRLNRARQSALAQRRKPTARWFIGAGLVSACALLLAVAVWHGRVGTPHAQGTATVVAANADDVDPLADDDDFYADMDFYALVDAADEDPEDYL
jgi:hypothetical protein